MSRGATSVLVFGVYLIVLGVVLIVVPAFLLKVFAFPPTEEIWIRVVGVLVLCLAYYYIQAARRELAAFLRWTVYARLWVFISLGAFAILGLARPALVLFGTVDLLGAVWTVVAMKAPLRA